MSKLDEILAFKNLGKASKSLLKVEIKELFVELLEDNESDDTHVSISDIREKIEEL